MNNFTVQKQSIFSKRDAISFAALVAIFLFFLIRYVIWWFQPSHIPQNWNSSYLHLLDITLFALLSFVVFISTILRIGSLFALAHGAKPKYVEPQKGLKVAFLTYFVPGKEPVEMLVKTLTAMKRVRYPHDSWVLDEGNSIEVKGIAKRLGVKYFTRFGISEYNQIEGKFRTKTKAGNHNAWADLFAKKYDIVAQIDMDHIPQEGFLEKTLGYFKDPKVGLVGMPQFYKNTQNWISKGAAEQSFFFQGQLQKGFYGTDMPFLIGTSHIYRTSAMEAIGGYAPTIVEDHLTGMNFYANGYKGVFVPEILARGEGPLNWVDYFNQQMRWSYGLFEIFFKHTFRIIHKLKWRQRINYFIAQLYYFTGVAVVVGFALILLYLVLGIRSANMDLVEWINFSLPPFLMGLALQIYTQKFGIDPDSEPSFGILGMFLNLGANIIYAIAFIKFISGQKLKYMVTQKGSAGLNQSVPLRTFRLHILLALIMFLAFIYSFKTGNNAVQLRLWALFNTITLMMVVLSTRWEKTLRKLNLFSLKSKSIKYGSNIALVLILLLVFGLTFTQSPQNVIALNYDQVTPKVEQPIAGKVVPLKNNLYLGLSLYNHNDTDFLNSLQNLTDKKFKIVGYYQSWGVGENKFDKNWAENIAQNGSIPLITWEPWVPIEGYDRSESKVFQKNYLLKNITLGQYDDYITSYAQAIKSYKGPILIRFAHEMNGNWYPWGSSFNNPQEYILAWRHVHEIFDSVGATNVTWVWSPNQEYKEKRVPYSDQVELFYPGDDYVDWVGFSAFNWAGTYKQNVWKDPEILYSDTLSKLKQFNKPIMITETASAEDRSNKNHKAVWLKKLSVYLQENPEIKGIVWFNSKDNGVNWAINSSDQSLQSFKEIEF